MTRHLPWLAVALLGGILLWGRADDSDATVQRLEQQKAAREKVIAALAGKLPTTDATAAKSHTVYVAATGEYQRLRDSLSKAGLRTDDKADPYVRLVEECEAALFAADGALSDCAKQVAARDTLLAQKDTLQSVTDSLLTEERKARPPRLMLYGEAGVSVPPSFLGARLDGEAGIALRLDSRTYLQAGATTRGEIRLSVRRQLRLF